MKKGSGHRRNAEVRRRKHRLTPGVIALTLVMVFGALAIVVPASAVASDSPPPHNCTVSISGSYSTQSTNATLSFEATDTPSQCGGAYVYVTLTWGNSTSYPFKDITNIAYTWNTEYSAPLLDYLAPSTTYYYHLLGTGGAYSGNYYGSWKTNQDSSNYVSGIVSDVNGTRAPFGMQVAIRCLPLNPISDWGTLATTSSKGVYSAQVVFSGVNECPHGMQVQALNVENGYTQWANRWNETIDVYAPQIVNFYVSTQTLTWVPVDYQFDHVTQAQGDTWMNYSSSATYTSTYAATIAGNGVQSTTSFGQSQGAAAPQGQGLEVINQLNTTGMTMFDALTNRTPYVQAVQYWGTAWHWYDGPPTKADWITQPPSLPSPGCAAVQVSPGYRAYVGMNVSGSFTNTAGFSLDISVGISIPGNGIGIGPSVGFPFEVTSSATSSSGSVATITIVNTASVLHWYEYCFDGQQSSSSGITSHLWETS
jgi:hypothetical protein